MSDLERAQLALDLGRWDEGGRLASRHLAEHPDDDRAHCMVAQARLGLGDARGALLAANAAIAAYPESDWPHRLASLALSRLGMAREALRAADNATRLNPDAWQTRVRLAAALSDTGRHHDAWFQAMAATSLAPEESSTHVSAGGVALAAGWLDLADYAYHRALAIDPEDSAALNDLGVIDERRRRWGSAMGRFSSSARLDPSDQVSARNVRLVGIKLTRLSVLAAALITSLVLLVAGGIDADPGFSPGRTVVAVLGLVALGAAARLLLRRLPRVVVPILRRMVLRSVYGVLCLLTLVVQVGIVVGLPWITAPAGATAGVWVLALLGLWCSVGMAERVTHERQPPPSYDWVPPGGPPAPEPQPRPRAFSWRKRDRWSP